MIHTLFAPCTFYCQEMENTHNQERVAYKEFKVFDLLAELIDETEV